MKKLSLILTITLFIITGSLLNAQDVRDVIELKSGSVYKGQIVKQMPDSTIKLLAEDGMYYILPVKDIHEITKETYTPVKEEIQSSDSSEHGNMEMLNERKPENSIPFSLMFFGALGMPVGDFASSTKGMAGEGFNLGFDGIVHSGSDYKFAFSMSYSVNPVNIPSELTNQGPEVSASSYKIIWGMIGGRIQPKTNSGLNFYITFLSGVAVCTGPEFTFSYRNATLGKLTIGNSTVFGYSLGLGIILSEKITFNLRYYNCEPEYSGIKQPTGIAGLMIGYNL